MSLSFDVVERIIFELNVTDINSFFDVFPDLLTDEIIIVVEEIKKWDSMNYRDIINHNKNRCLKYLENTLSNRKFTELLFTFKSLGKEIPESINRRSQLFDLIFDSKIEKKCLVYILNSIIVHNDIILLKNIFAYIRNDLFDMCLERHLYRLISKYDSIDIANYLIHNGVSCTLGCLITDVFANGSIQMFDFLKKEIEYSSNAIYVMDSFSSVITPDLYHFNNYGTFSNGESIMRDMKIIPLAIKNCNIDMFSYLFRKIIDIGSVYNYCYLMICISLRCGRFDIADYIYSNHDVIIKLEDIIQYSLSAVNYLVSNNRKIDENVYLKIYRKYLSYKNISDIKLCKQFMKDEDKKNKKRDSGEKIQIHNAVKINKSEQYKEKHNNVVSLHIFYIYKSLRNRNIPTLDDELKLIRKKEYNKDVDEYLSIIFFYDCCFDNIERVKHTLKNYGTEFISCDILNKCIVSIISNDRYDIIELFHEYDIAIFDYLVNIREFVRRAKNNGKIYIIYNMISKYDFASRLYADFFYYDKDIFDLYMKLFPSRLRDVVKYSPHSLICNDTDPRIVRDIIKLTEYSKEKLEVIIESISNIDVLNEILIKIKEDNPDIYRTISAINDYERNA